MTDRHEALPTVTVTLLFKRLTLQEAIDLTLDRTTAARRGKSGRGQSLAGPL